MIIQWSYLKKYDTGIRWTATTGTEVGRLTWLLNMGGLFDECAELRRITTKARMVSNKLERELDGVVPEFNKEDHFPGS